MPEKKDYNAVQDDRTTTLFGGVFSNVKSAIGAGALFIPFRFSQVGWAVGLAVLILASATTTASLHFLQRLSARTDLGDYFALGRLALGAPGEILAVISLIFFLLGGLIYYIALSSTYFIEFLVYLKPTLKNEWYMEQTKVMVFAALLIFPLACMRDMRMLAKASIIGMACMFYILIWAVVDMFYDAEVTKTAVVAAMVPASFKVFVIVFSNLLFAFVNHFTMLSTIPTFINPTPKRRMALTLISAVIVFTFNAVLGLAGYGHFGDRTPEIIVQPSIYSIEWPYRLAQLLVSIVLILSFPLLCDPTRACIEHIVSIITKNKEKSFIQNLLITGSIIGVATTLGIAAKDQVSVVLNAFSAFAGSVLVFIFPSLFFLRLAPKYPVKGIERGMAYFNIVFGVVLMIFGTYYNVGDMITRFTKSA